MVQLAMDFGAPVLRVSVLGSGSSGNAVVLESGRERLLVDAGFSCRELESRLARVGLEPVGFEGLVLTHEHGDHVRGAARFSRRHRVPVFATAGTLEAAALRGVRRAIPIRTGEPTRIGSFRLEPFAVSHDAREPVGLVVEDGGGRRLGLAADLGTRCQDAWERLRDLDLLILETNHDVTMLREGPYPWPLKERIAGRCGHLSNREAAEGLREVAGPRLRAVLCYHLSRTNNLPELAHRAVAAALATAGCAAEVVVTSQARPSRWVEVSRCGAGAAEIPAAARLG